MTTVCRPNVRHAWNLLDKKQDTYLASGHGRTLADLAPVTRNPVLCSVGNDFYDKQDWHLVQITPEDAVTFQVVPQGNNGNAGSVMAVIGVVLIAVGAYTGNYQLVAQGAGLLLGGVVSAGSGSSPIAPVGQQQQQPSPTYNAQLGGNTARIGQALPVPYGRHPVMPDFASNPYTYYGANDVQYYCVLLSFGMMTHFRVETIGIDDTQLTHFTDWLLEYIGAGNAGGVPGVGTIASLSLVHPAVITAPEVASQDLTHTEYAGPFSACGPGLECEFLEIDYVFPQGLYYAEDNGALSNQTAQVLSEYRLIHPVSGAPIGTWNPLGFETITRNQNSPVRLSYKYPVAPGRYEVRVSRVDIRDSNIRSGHGVQWAGLKAYLTLSSPLEEAGNYVALKIKATSQLSGLSQRRVSMIVRRWLPAWSLAGGWAAPAETQSIAWAAADIATNTDYGMGLDIANVDMETLEELHAVWDARQDVFNAVFDRRITAWDALTTVLRCGRARPVMRGSVLTFVRDQEQALPAAIYTQFDNILRDSFRARFNLVQPDDVDGVEVAFFNRDTWATEFVVMPIPGSGVVTPLAPKSVPLMGVTNLKQAQRLCAFFASCGAYRQSQVDWTTELEGHLPPFGDMVSVVHDVMGVGSAGVVTSWDGATAVGSETITWTVGTNYAVLRDDKGAVHGPYRVAPGAVPNSFVFLDAPAIYLYSGTEKDRTGYAIGPGSAFASRVKLLGMTPDDEGNVALSGTFDDPEPYLADLPYLSPTNYIVNGDAEGGGIGGGIPGSRACLYVDDTHPSYATSSTPQRDAGGYYCDDSYLVDGDPPYTYT